MTFSLVLGHVMKQESATETLREPCKVSFCHILQRYELTSQYSTQVRCWMCELVLLIIPVLEVDEDAQVMRSCDHAHARASKLRTQLVVPLCTNTLLGAVDVEGRNGRVVGGLFGEVGDSDSLAVASHAVGAARGSRVRCLQGGVRVFDLPVTLQVSVLVCNTLCKTYPEELAQR